MNQTNMFKKIAIRPVDDYVAKCDTELYTDVVNLLEPALISCGIGSYLDWSNLEFIDLMNEISRIFKK